MVYLGKHIAPVQSGLQAANLYGAAGLQAGVAERQAAEDDLGGLARVQFGLRKGGGLW